MYREFGSKFAFLNALPARVLVAANLTGADIDTRGYNGAVIAVNIGNAQSVVAASYAVLRLQHTDASALGAGPSDYADVTSADLIRFASQVGAMTSGIWYSIDSTAYSGTVQYVAYKGSKRYVRLILEVKTDGTITPEDAIAQAAEILVSHFLMLSRIGGKAIIQIEKQAAGPTTIPQKVYDTPIEELDLSVRAYNCLKRVGITKVGQVLEMSEEDLLGVRNFGRKSLDELREKLEARGFLPGSRLAESAQEAEAAPEPERPELAQPVAAPEQTAEEPEAAEEEEAEREPEAEEQEVPAQQEAPEEEVEEPTEELPQQPSEFEVYDEDLLERLEEEDQEELSRKKRRRGKRER